MSKGMILIVGTYFHPYSIVAVTDHVVGNHSIAGSCEIWCGPTEGDQFVVCVSKEEAVKLINDWLGEDGA